MRSALVVLASAFVTGGAMLVACSSSSNDTTTADAGTDASVDAGANVETDACALDPIDLVISQSNGVPNRIHVPITYDGGPAYMMVDTGSQLTFLSEPAGTPDGIADAGTIDLGCRAIDLIGRTVVADTPVLGKPSVGTMGDDLLAVQPTEIDFSAKKLLFHDPGTPFGEAANWPFAPYDDVYGLVVTHVTVDGVAVRLELDTGSPDLLLVGAQPKPGDVEVHTTDAIGDDLSLYSGTADLQIGTTHLTVPILRAPSFPYFDEGVKALGGNIQGLLGLSSVGKSAIVIDTDAKAVRVAP